MKRECNLFLKKILNISEKRLTTTAVAVFNISVVEDCIFEQ